MLDALTKLLGVLMWPTVLLITVVLEKWWTGWKRSSVNTSKPAIRDHFKTGQRDHRQDMQ